MDPARVESIIANSQRLMSPQGQRLIENRERGKLGKKPLPNAQPTYEEKPYNYQAQPYTPQTQYIPQQPTRQFQNEALRESFEKMPPIQIDTTGGYNPNGYQPGQSIIAEQQQYSQPAQYQQPVYSQPQPQVYPQGNGVDYSFIKSMINEAIRENLGYMKERLQENELRGVRIDGGNKIQLLDKKGNLYEGTLTLKKKAQ